MLTTDQINDLRYLYWSEHWPIRRIERHLRMSWRTIKKYLEAPAQTPATRPRVSKLDPFKTTIVPNCSRETPGPAPPSSSSGSGRSVMPAATPFCATTSQGAAAATTGKRRLRETFQN